MTDQENHNHQEETNEMRAIEAWRAQDALVKKLEGEGAERYFAEITDLKKLFTLEDRYLRCVDEGTPGGLHSPGSQIMVGNIEEALEEIRSAGITGIASHEGCGAAALAKKDAKTFSEELAEKAGLPYFNIPTSEMKRPSFHDARVIYYDGSASFNWDQGEGVPKGFIVTVPYFRQASASLDLCVQIATGHHGFGIGMFRERGPLNVVVIGSSSDDRYATDRLEREAKKALFKYGDLVRITKFQAPEEQQFDAA